jgi:ABC-type Mn2+/Zn2+ transport system permease subunit
MLTNSFARMLTIAPIIGALCGFTGMLLSYHIDVSPGATIILMASAVFLVVFTITGSRGRRNVAGLGHH